MPYKERKLNSQTFGEYHLVPGKLLRKIQCELRILYQAKLPV